VSRTGGTGGARRAAWLALAGAALAAAGFALYFNLWLYPGLGLSGFSRADSQAALGQAALGFARSTGMAMDRFDMVKFREIEGGEAYVWGAAVMRPADAARPGGEVLVWVYLSFDGFRRSWVRVDAQVLAADDNEMYFEPGRPGQFERARLALRKIADEEARRFREVWP
jgi:hypothetical protein